MKINENKSKVMLFNKSKKYDFPPEFSFKDGEILECLEETTWNFTEFKPSLGF